MCTISLGVIPIHDITPGLDHEGFNRAPIYTVGESSTGAGGDPWYNTTKYNQLIGEIKAGHSEATMPPEGYEGDITSKAFHVAQMRDAKLSKKSNSSVAKKKDDK